MECHAGAVVHGVEDVEEGQRKGVNPTPNKEPYDQQKLPLRALFRYADGVDRALVAIAFAAAIVNGAIVPVFSIIFGDLVNALGGTMDDLVDEVNKSVLYLLYLAIAALIAGYVEVAFFSWTGFRQTAVIRQAYLDTVLRQEVAWFDANGGTGKLLQGLNEDSIAFQNAISERLGNFIRNITTCVAGLIVAFWKGWDMALVIVATMPFLVGVGMAISVVTGRLKIMVAGANDKTNGLAQEALLNIRTITSYAMQDDATKRFEDSLDVPRKAGIKQGFLSGLTVGATSGVFSCSYALAIWYGSLQVAKGDYTGGKVINILFAGVMAGFSLGQAVPNIQFIEAGKVAVMSLCSIIDRKPGIDVNDSGLELQELKGDIELDDVTFHYPTRPDRTVFKGMNLIIPAGNSVALVGESGSGKSSVIQLLQRFYDPAHGKILIDGHDLRTLQLSWWRSQVSLVSQEPTLFDDSIFANIAISKAGATMAEVIDAATAANAHAFIMRLPDRYNTSVGEQGSQLSGGQRQRIAIARAMLRNPKVLLLDEATSALDNQSEKLVQESLERVMTGRTTIIVAHRLSTVVNSDIIAVVRDGRIVEQGSHGDLLKKQGFYSSLVARQMMDPEAGEGSVEEFEQVTVKKPLKKMRDSVLTRASVRLSVIPQDIMNKLKRAPDAQESQDVSIHRLARLNKPEWRQAVLGMFSSAALGLQMPGFALALAGIIGVFYKPTEDEIKDGGLKWAGIYLAIGVGCLLMGMLQGWSFGVMGHNLACRVKVLFLKAALRQEIGWHDQADNNTGKVMSRLSSDTMAIRGAVGDQMGVIVQNVSTVLAAYIIAFYSSWSLTLVVTALLPLMSLAQFVQTLMLTGQFSKGNDEVIQANQVALEGVRSIRIVAAYGLQHHISDKYAEATRNITDTKILHFAGVAYGFSQFVLYCVICLAFWYGAKGISKGDMSVEDLMRAFCALFFATFSLAQANVQFPEMGKAHQAAERVFSVIDRIPDINVASEAGAKLPSIDGDIELDNVTFAYPSRPGRLIFKSFNLKIPAGTSCALVGESGHGKSTIVGLVERFYDATDGKVLIDGVDVRSLNLRWLRSHIGLVGQEPVMFQTSILQNIRYGNPHATVSQVVDAARAANALDFVNRLPEQFDTKIGDGGIQLSGGQKQRIAIARAILRDPKILLLDEATSALDTESEASVQSALDDFMIGRTTVIIAHRLTTVQHATKIAAVYRGRVLEEGTHEELMKLDRYYAFLVRASQC